MLLLVSVFYYFNDLLRVFPCSEFGVSIFAEVYRNHLKSNRGLSADTTTLDLTKGATYSIALRGVQKVSCNVPVHSVLPSVQLVIDICINRQLLMLNWLVVNNLRY